MISLKKTISQITLGMTLLTSIHLKAEQCNYRTTLIKGLETFSERQPTAEGMDSSLKAAQFFRLASTCNGATPKQKAEALMHESSAYFYVGDVMPIKGPLKKLRMERLQKGADIALEAASFIEEKDENGHIVPGRSLDPSNSKLLANIYYWYGASGARKAETLGVVAALPQWDKLQTYMGYIINMHKEGLIHQSEIEHYGAYRILGRAMFSIAQKGLTQIASFEEALEKQEEAYKGTLDDYNEEGQKTSFNGLNNLYYAETLMELKRYQEAYVVLSNFVAVDPEELDPEHLPELQVEIAAARLLLLKLKTMM